MGLLAETAIAIGAELGHVFGETSAGGVSDGSWAASQGLPTLDGLGPVGGEDHTPSGVHRDGEHRPALRRRRGLVAAVDAGTGLAARGLSVASRRRPTPRKTMSRQKAAPKAEATYSGALR